MTNNSRNPNRWLSLLSPIALLVLWEVAVRAGWLNRIFYPPPSDVFATLGTLIQSGQIFTDVSISLRRIALGFLLGGVPGIIIGLLMGVSPTVRALVRPIASAIYPIPKIALLPLIIVALGIGETSKVVTIAVSVFFLVVLNVAASVAQVDPQYFDVARSFGANKRQQFWTVALPGSMPGVMSSIKLGMGFALTLIVGVEFVGAKEGIGYLIWHSYEIFAINRMLAGLVVIAIVGWLITLLLDELELLLVPWQAGSVRKRRRWTTLIPSSIVHRPSSIMGIWWPAIRPWSYTAAIIPVALGGAIAAYEGKMDLWLFALTLIGSIAIQGGTNLVNDYYDYRKGADNAQSLGTGGSLIRGDLTPRQVLVGGLAAFSVGIIIGLYLVSITGPFIFWLGLFSVLVGFFYTAGPFALAYVGLGEIAVFFFMGPVIVVGSYYVQTQTVTWPVVLASLPVGFLVAAILHANNLRDLDADRKIGKRTLATLLGRHGANIEYYVLVWGTYLSLVALVILGVAPWLTLISLATLPLAIKLIQIVRSETEPKQLQPVLRGTARLHMRFGGLLIAGWLLASWVLANSI